MSPKDDLLDSGLKHITDPAVRELILRGKQVRQLPLWPEPKRAAPNEIVRSALFNIRNHRTKREYYTDVPVVVIGDGSITYRGEELRQDDLDVWLQLMHLARAAKISPDDIKNDQPTVKIVPHSFCKAIGWPPTGHYYAKLENIMGRLSATELIIKSSRLKESVGVSMIRKKRIREDKDKTTRMSEWFIWLEPEIVTLFAGNYFSAIDWEIRKNLSALGKWLQAYYQSHSEPYPVKVETIMSGCGSSNARVRDFRELLEKALKELYDSGFLKKWWLADGLVHVIRNK